MNIIFFGDSNISKPMIQLFLKYKFNLTYMFHSKKILFKDDKIDLRDFLKKKKIKILKFNNIKSKNLYRHMDNVNPDYIFSIGSSLILPKKIINLPKFGCVGFHPTKLPLNKGRHPIIWTILLGLNKSATTFFYINDQIDDGDIIHQKNFLIPKKINANNLYKLITKNAIFQLKFLLNSIRKKEKLLTIKNNSNFSNYWRSRSFSDGVISWKMSFEYIDRLVRALSYPYSGAVFHHKEKFYSVYKVKKIRENFNSEPGKIIKLNLSSFDIACFDYILRVYCLKLPKNFSNEVYLK